MELGDARGFEVNPPLAQKGYGNEPGYWRIMACRDLEYYRWEYERYWFYYLLFGRMSYNPETSPEVWRRELRSRFGPKAEIAEKAYAVSSKVISYLIRYQMSDPNMYTWPEIDTGGILDYYMETYPSDPATMHSIAEAAAFRLTERTSAKVTPEEASTYFENIGRQCLEMAKELESSDSDRELVATRLDVSVLGNMALYHAYKIRSAEQLSLYYLTKDLAALKQAAALIREANSFWHECVRLTDGFYYDHMVTGPIDSGHWKDKLVLIDDDEKRLEELIRLYEECAPFDYAFDFGGKPERRTRRENMIFSIHDNYHVEKHFIGVDEVSRYNPITGFGWTTSTRVVGATHPHIRISDRDLDDRRRDTGRVFNECLVGFRNALYNDYVWSNAPGSFLVDLPDGVYEATIIAANPENNTSDYGPMYAQINGQLLLDGVVVPKGKKLVVKREVEVVGGRLRLDLWADSGKSWFISGLVINRAGITLTHVPPSRLDAEQECTLQVTAKGTIDTVRSVWFNVCDDNSSNDSKDCCSSSRMVELKQVDDFIYEGAIPKELLKNSRQLRYCIVAEGTSGRRYILGTEQPFSVPVKHRESVIEVEHEPVRYAKWSNDIRIRCRIASSNPIKVVRLYYRHVNQYYTFQVQPMKLVDPSEMIYEGVIPAEYHDRNWDLMYYVEVVDGVGTGIFYPDPMKETPYIVIREEQSH
ncbi:MAG: hypothetical protein GX855_09590, partial [Firmicutes bacterium]|nr:hypothetical protein [Bacillota bacterium]